MLNIACDSRYHKNWVNVDFHSDSALVTRVNILKGLPFDDNSFDIIYSSHFLEHLTKDEGLFFLNETYRILKVNGIIRIVVPDLENICREYLILLEKVLDGSIDDIYYDYIIAELIDQCVRNEPGGHLLKVYRNDKIRNNKSIKKYILNRVGENIDVSLQFRGKKNNCDRIKNKLLYLYLNTIRLLIPHHLRSQVMINVPIGELHKWMYDRYSLPILLKNANFKDPYICQYNESMIPDFNTYFLDMSPDGFPYKGYSSLYIEANK